MSKRRHHDDRQSDLFTAALRMSGPAAHAGIEAWVSAMVGDILDEDRRARGRSREEVAAAMTSDMVAPVSWQMLDGYAAPARGTFNISFGKAIVLMAVTGHRRLAEEAVAKLGGRILWDREIDAARLGHLQAQRDRIDNEIKELRRQGVAPIERGGRK